MEYLVKLKLYRHVLNELKVTSVSDYLLFILINLINRKDMKNDS